MGADCVEVGSRNVSGVVAVAGIWFREAVHVEQLPVCHLTVGVENLLTFLNRPHTNHLQTVLGTMETEIRKLKKKKKLNLAN